MFKLPDIPLSEAKINPIPGGMGFELEKGVNYEKALPEGVKFVTNISKKIEGDVIPEKALEKYKNSPEHVVVDITDGKAKELGLPSLGPQGFFVVGKKT